MMKTDQDVTLSGKRIYSDQSIWAAGILAGPLVIGYLIAENFKVFGECEKAVWTWVIAVLFFIILISSLFLFPALENVPNLLIPLAYTAIAVGIAKHYQGKNIAGHIKHGGLLYSWKRVLGVGILGLLVTLIGVIGIIWMVDVISMVGVTTKTYGVRQHEISFHRDNISDREVDVIADGLVVSGFFDEARTKYVYARKLDGVYELSISVADGIEKNAEAVALFNQLRVDLQKELPDNKIHLNLFVDTWDNVVKRLE